MVLSNSEVGGFHGSGTYGRFWAASCPHDATLARC